MRARLLSYNEIPRITPWKAKWIFDTSSAWDFNQLGRLVFAGARRCISGNSNDQLLLVCALQRLPCADAEGVFTALRTTAKIIGLSFKRMRPFEQELGVAGQKLGTAFLGAGLLLGNYGTTAAPTLQSLQEKAKLILDITSKWGEQPEIFYQKSCFPDVIGSDPSTWVCTGEYRVQEKADLCPVCKLTKTKYFYAIQKGDIKIWAGAECASQVTLPASELGIINAIRESFRLRSRSAFVLEESRLFEENDPFLLEAWVQYISLRADRVGGLERLYSEAL